MLATHRPAGKFEKAGGDEYICESNRIFLTVNRKQILSFTYVKKNIAAASLALCLGLPSFAKQGNDKPQPVLSVGKVSYKGGKGHDTILLGGVSAAIYLIF